MASSKKTAGKIASQLADPDGVALPVTKKFVLYRKVDVSGNSGTGVVAIGFVMPSGFCVMEWVSVEKSLGIYHSVAQLEKIHGHGGATEVRFVQ